MVKQVIPFIALLLFIHLNVSCQDSKVNEDLSLKYLVQMPVEKTEHPPVIILLHGRGSNEANLFALRNKLPPNYLIVAARAPYELATASYEWFEMSTVNGKREPDTAQLANSRKLVARFISEIVNKYKAGTKQVYIIGFSQGAMMSYEIGLTAPDKIKGIGVLSGVIFESSKPSIKNTPALKQLKIFVGHGTADERIKFAYAASSVDYLKSIGLNPEFHTYQNMTHEISNEEINDLLKWIKR